MIMISLFGLEGQTTGVAAGQRLVRRGIRTVKVQVRVLGI